MEDEVFILGPQRIDQKERRDGRDSGRNEERRREKIEKGSRERIEKERKEKEAKGN